MTPAGGMRFGNWLYLWLDAHQRTASGEPTLVLERDDMTPWLEEFPALRTLSIEPTLLRFHDRRDHNVRKPNRFGVDFTRESLRAFIGECLAPALTPDETDTLVVNVRRGDYYTADVFREMFGFDQLGYLRAAVGLTGSAERVLVVSDDEAWCRDNVDDIVRPVAAAVEYMPTDPRANFRAVAGARRIIGMNSTFTYWAAYTAGVLHAAPQIVMPRFHARNVEGGEAVQLDPEWTIIDGYDR